MAKAKAKTETAEETFALPPRQTGKAQGTGPARAAEIELPKSVAVATPDPGPMKIIEHWNPRDLKIIRDNVAKGTTEAEFLEFMARCRLLQLNPIKREIYCIIYNAMKPDRRQVVHVISVGGYRRIAQRNGDYLGIKSSEAPVLVFSDIAKDPDTNPRGLVSAEVKVWRRLGPNEYWDHWGIARWDELAPMYWDKSKSKRCLKDGFWKTMPQLMLEKCAEAAAIRRAWPDQFNGTYGDEEMERGRADQDILEIIDQLETDDALAKAKVSATTYLLTFGSPAQVPVEQGTMVDTAAAYLRTLDGEEALAWEDANRPALKEFHGRNKADGIEVKRLIEQRVSEGSSQPGPSGPGDEPEDPGPPVAAEEEATPAASEGPGGPIPEADQEPAAFALWLGEAILETETRKMAEQIWVTHREKVADEMVDAVQRKFESHWEGLRK